MPYLNDKKKFGGEAYKLYRSFNVKSEAKNQARVLRSDGKARVTPYKFGGTGTGFVKHTRYAVWYKK